VKSKLALVATLSLFLLLLALPGFASADYRPLKPTPTPTPVPTATGDRTITLTLTCTTNACNGSWFLRAGGISGTLLGSGSMTGNAGTTTVETTTQPAAVDTVNFGVGSGGSHSCGSGAIDYITPGSAFNFTAIVPTSRLDYHTPIPCAGAGSSFNLQS
jgi:hypothetical protein